MRRFFNSSIEQLERLFAEQGDNADLLGELAEELTHRTTIRANRLRVGVVQRLDTLGRDQARSFQTPPTYKSPEPVQTRAGSGSHAEELPVRIGPDLANPQVTSGPTPPSVLGPHPAITNRPEEVLAAWTALEVLSPPSYRRAEDLAGGDRRRVAALNEPLLPWERQEKSRPHYRLYYQVVLGSVHLAPTVGRLLERFGDSREERPDVRGEIVLASVMVDRRGCLVESPAVAVSSFGWGVMTALNGALADLAEWASIESKLTAAVEHRLLDVPVGAELDAERRGLPLTRAAIQSAHLWLVATLGLPAEWVVPPEFAIRSYVYFRDSNPPEPLLLNSFFLTDLALARDLLAGNAAPRNLTRYLGLERPASRGDLLGDAEVLRQAVGPANTHAARWPGPDRHPLVLLQQAAVNAAFTNTREGGLLGINGPPGTGKTTLLRDLVAGVVVERAEIMATFEDPATAFTHSGQQLRAGNGWTHLYRLDPSLRGFEMLVASSNNNAVANVSAELPGIAAIADDAPELRYFKTLADAVHGTETWGMIAAVLGNGQNRARFKQTFWWDDDLGLNTYLRAAAGSPRQIQDGQTATGAPRYRAARIVEQERPPSTHDEAVKRWRRARRSFLAALKQSRQCQAELDRLANELASLPQIRHAVEDAASRHSAVVQANEGLETLAAAARLAEATAARRSDEWAQRLQTHSRVQPGRWARLFRTGQARAWSAQSATLQAGRDEALTLYEKAQKERSRSEEDLRRAQFDQQAALSDWHTAFEQYSQVQQRLKGARELGVELTDDAFFALPHHQRHRVTPWYTPAAQRARDEVFIAAVALHRAFIDAAAKPLRHNLGGLMQAFTSQAQLSGDRQALLPDLWSSLFLVVPLVSTTFASCNRMLGKLPAESLGWLLVDEAGQAAPQAAVGALLRARRAVIVGDPAQIEPVVMLPDALTQAICRHLGVDPDRYAAPAASVQSLADAASAYASEFETAFGSRSVGLPLLVHRRCSEPMFSIANAIAYAGLMVSAKAPQASAIRDTLGPSAWIHVEGSGEDKWCPAEGTEVVRLLRRLAQAGAKPDLYIISPFVMVAEGLRQALRASGVLQQWQDIDAENWLREKVGTVHTAQGREAEAVILVLGAPSPSQTGARGWAGGRPTF